MNKYLLTPDELKEIKIPYRDDDDIYSAVERIVFYSIKAQDRKSRKVQLEQLEKEGMLKHDKQLQPDDSVRQGWSYTDTCTPDCRACAALREAE